MHKSIPKKIMNQITGPLYLCSLGTRYTRKHGIRQETTPKSGLPNCIKKRIENLVETQNHSPKMITRVTQ